MGMKPRKKIVLYAAECFLRGEEILIFNKKPEKKRDGLHGLYYWSQMEIQAVCRKWWDKLFPNVKAPTGDDVIPVTFSAREVRE